MNFMTNFIMNYIMLGLIYFSKDLIDWQVINVSMFLFICVLPLLKASNLLFDKLVDCD